MYPQLSDPSFALKRFFDLVVAAIGLLFGWPLLGFLAVLVRLESPGPILYRQIRLGFRGRPFVLFKFRTMGADAEEVLDLYLEDNPQRRQVWSTHQKLFSDPRLTRLGAFLRRSSLDELPQLWNVLKGEMSLVGPRPILPDQLEEYRNYNCEYGSMPPGLTGLWQTSGRNTLSFAERAQLDHKYVNNWSLVLDVRILLRTVPAVLRMDGAF